MTCEEFQIRLLTADDPAAAARENDIAAHLASCAECASILAKLIEVEEIARSLPEPMVAASASRVAFLNRLSESESTADIKPSKPTFTARWSAYRLVPRIAAAAAILLLLISGVWVLTGDVSSADASSAVVGQLVEWNYNLAQAGTPEERNEIFASAVGPLQRRVATAKLLPEDRELAKKLLDNGQALASNDDPIEDVERMNDTADLLLKRIQVATSRGNSRAVRAFSYNYALLCATASGSTLQKIEPPTGENPQRFERLEKMIRHDADLRKRLQLLLEQYPAATRQEINAALKLPQPPSRKATTKPTAKPTTRPVRPNHPEFGADRPVHPNRLAQQQKSQLTPDQQKLEQEMRERRVREWFKEFKNQKKAGDSGTTAPAPTISQSPQSEKR